MNKYTLAFCFITACSTAAYADGLSGEITAGYQNVQGNSDSSSLNGKIGVGYTTGIWEHNFELKGSQEKEDREVTGERYKAIANSKLNFTKHDYFFNEATYTHDQFAGVRKSLDDAIGYGRRLIKTERQKLDVQLGVGYRHMTSQEPERERSNEVIGTGGLDYTWKISDSSKFSQKFRVKSGSDNTNYISESELKLRIYGHLNAILGYMVEYNTDVTEDTEHADRYTTVNLSYEFGQ